MEEFKTLYFEEIESGDTFVTSGRTITEADVVSFAGTSGDYNELHVNQSYAEETIHQGRIAHGLLVLSITSGLCTHLIFNKRLHDSILAAMGLTCRWLAPVKIGDTIHVEMKIKEKKETSKPERGIVIFERNTFNQRGEKVLTSEWPVLIKRLTE